MGPSSVFGPRDGNQWETKKKEEHPSFFNHLVFWQPSPLNNKAHIA